MKYRFALLLLLLVSLAAPAGAGVRLYPGQGEISYKNHFLTEVRKRDSETAEDYRDRLDRTEAGYANALASLGLSDPDCWWKPASASQASIYCSGEFKLSPHRRRAGHWYTFKNDYVVSSERPCRALEKFFRAAEHPGAFSATAVCALEQPSVRSLGWYWTVRSCAGDCRKSRE
jgi:hypothetical protein